MVFLHFVWGRSRYRVMKYGVGVKWDTRRTAGYVPSHFHGFWTPFSTMCLLKIVIFHELLIVETCNKCHWIWHASNPKYAPFKNFQCIFPHQNQQNVKFCLKLWFSGTTYCRDLKTCGIGFCMIGTLSMCHSSHFNAFFPVKINKM